MNTETIPQASEQDTFSCWLCAGPARVDERYAEVPYYRCADCGFLFAPQRPVDELHAIYDDSYFEEYWEGADYEADLAQRQHEASLRIDWISRFVTSGRLLEIGAANGTFLQVARERGYDVAGIEPAPGLAAHARDELGLDVQTGFIENAKLPEEKYDLVCGWHVLEHITEPKASLDRLRRAIADDGHLFFEIPNIASLQAQREGAAWVKLDPANHVAFYDADQMRKLLADSGFKLIDVDSVSGFHYMGRGRAFKPRELAARTREAILTRTLPSRPHPWKHELLRAVAVPA